ncbi:Cytochrome P450 7B1 [Tulasnella sp. JGI-2019a]|nr:Cytochrome P450 7B1 [Tulasnella sp. JGI-2019a]
MIHLVSLLPFAKALQVVFLFWCGIRLVRHWRRGGKNRPPVVSYILPWVGSAISIGKDADVFYKKAREDHGDIFAVHVAGARFVYTTSVPKIAAIYRNTKTFRFDPVPKKIVSVFGMSPPSVKAEWMRDVFYPSHVKMLSPGHVGCFMDAFSRHSSDIIGDIAGGITNGRQMTLEDFIIPMVFEVISATMFGKEFPATSIFELFKEYDDLFPILVAEMPKLLTVKTRAAQSKLIDVMTTYLRNPSKEAQAQKVLSLYTAGMTDASPKWSERDVAAALLGEFWGPEANMTWGLYWIIAYALHEPMGLAPLVRELDQARAQWLKTHPTDDLLENPEALLAFLTNAELPIFEAHFAEALRLTSSRFSARTVAAGGATLGGYDLLEGEMIICAGRYVHLNDDIYPNATAFKPERFLTADGRFNKKEAQKPFLAFGGGVSQCQGRHYTTRACRIVVALLLMHFDIRLDPGKPSSIQLDLMRVGTGVLHPKIASHIVVSRRESM